MADLFNKHIKKATSRTKEKLLEGIGKAKATQDEVFDNHAANLHKQSKACEKLHKDIKSYCAALKTLCSAEKTLRDSIREFYEPEWPEREHLTALLDNLDIQTDVLERAMGEDLVQGVAQYVGQFPDLKKKIDKRGRKLVDYDHSKNSYASLKSSSKKPDPDADPKVVKALNELQQSEAMYKEINNELLEILPATYDSRITFFVDTLQTMFNAHSINQLESGKMNKQVVSQLDKLGQSMDYLRVPRPDPRALTPIDTIGAETGSVGSAPSPAALAVPATGSGNVTPQPTATPNPTPSEGSGSGNPFEDEAEDVTEEVIEQKVYPKLTSAPRAERKTTDSPVVVKKEKVKDPNNPFDDSEDESVEEVTIGVTKEDRKVIYTVKSAHEYAAVDTDELSFPPGVTIKVLESKESDQLDDGWQLGELEDGTRGVFPENFTKKVE